MFDKMKILSFWFKSENNYGSRNEGALGGGRVADSGWRDL
jgi:hypothetical protein